MSTLGSTGLIKSADNSLVININETYFPDSSYNFYRYDIDMSFASQTKEIPNIFSTGIITQGLWYVCLNVWFIDSPRCAAAICTTAFNSSTYGYVNTLYENSTPLTLPTDYVFVAWNAVYGGSSGWKNGVSTSCMINVPISTTAAIGCVIYSQTTSATPNVTVVMTATRIGPPQTA
jgi:hypothetical protein